MGGVEYCVYEAQVAPRMKLYVVDDVSIIDRISNIDILERGLTESEALIHAEHLKQLNKSASD